MVGIKDAGGNRRKRTDQKILWNTFVSGRLIPQERRKSADTILTLEQVQELASEGKIKGFSGVLESNNGDLHVIVTGSFYDDPLAASGAINKLQSTLDFFPEHPVLKLPE